MNPKNFFAELKRRNVYKVAIAYAVVAWLLMQIATQVFPFLEIPNWAIRLVIMLIVIRALHRDQQTRRINSVAGEISSPICCSIYSSCALMLE